MNYSQIRRCTDCVHSFSHAGFGTQCKNPHVLADTPSYLSGDTESTIAEYERATGTICGKDGKLFTSKKRFSE